MVPYSNSICAGMLWIATFWFIHMCHSSAANRASQSALEPAASLDLLTEAFLLGQCV